MDRSLFAPHINDEELEDDALLGEATLAKMSATATATAAAETTDAPKQDGAVEEK